MPHFFSSRRLATCLAFAWVPAAIAATTPQPVADNAKLRDTRWRVQSIDGASLAAVGTASVSPHLVLNARSQQLSGHAGCSRIQGRYVQRGTQLALTTAPASAAATARCTPSQAQAQARLLQALSSVDAYRIEGGVLSLMQGETVRMTFVAAKAKAAVAKPKASKP